MMEGQGEIRVELMKLTELFYNKIPNGGPTQEQGRYSALTVCCKMKCIYLI